MNITRDDGEVQTPEQFIVRGRAYWDEEEAEHAREERAGAEMVSICILFILCVIIAAIAHLLHVVDFVRRAIIWAAQGG